MLLRFYKSSYLPQFVTLILLGTALWAKSILSPETAWYASAANPVFNLMNFYILKIPVTGTLISFIVLMSQAFYLSYILAKNELIPKNSLIPALIMILAGSMHRDLMVFHPGTLPGLFVLIALGRLLRCYGRTDIARDILSASFYLSLASLFYFQSALLILLIWITLLIFSASSIRDWVIPLIGIVIPYIYLYSYYYVFDNPIPGAAIYLEFFLTSWKIDLNLSLFDYFIWGLMVLLFLGSLLYYFNHIQEKTIIIRKKMAVIWWMVILGFVLLFRSPEGSLDSFSLLIPALAIMISSFLSWIKKPRIYEIMIWILILLIIIDQYFL